MKILKPTLLTHEIEFTFLGRIGLTQGKDVALPVWLRLPPTSLMGPFSKAATKPSRSRYKGVTCYFFTNREGPLSKPSFLAP